MQEWATSTPIEDATGFAAVADRHHRRRRDGIPTITTIVGPIPLSIRCWREWCRGRDVEPVIVRPSDDWFITWSATLLGEDLLWNAATDYAARCLGQSGDVFRTRVRYSTPHELEQRFRNVGLDASDSGSGGLVVRLICSSGRIGADADREVDIGAAQRVSAKPVLHRQSFKEVVSLMPSDALSPIAFRLDAIDEYNVSSQDLAAAVHQVVDLATTAPVLPIAILITQPTWRETWRELPDGFDKSAASENMIEVVGLSTTEVSSRLKVNRTNAEGDSAFEGLHQCAQRLSKLVEAPTERLVDALRNVVQLRPCLGDTRTHSADAANSAVESDVESESPFRSAAEKFLFQLLEHHAATIGLFGPNGDPGFRFGSRAAEVDLLCKSLKIAIEVDGYYHFCDPMSYRRDRRKDYLMQQYGFLVLRFLAQDVVERMEDVLEAVVAAVQFRRSHQQVS